ncbi:unnamed protein product [Cunninghamella blakesleeana]
MKNKITSLEFGNIYYQNANAGASTTTSGVNSFTKPGNKSPIFIQLTKDGQIRERKCMQIPYPKKSSIHNGIGNQDPMNYFMEFIENLKDNDGYINHYGKVMAFPTGSTTFWYHLKHLDIDFSQISKHNLQTIKVTFELDERTLNAIHESCLSLTTLILRSIFINISTHFYSHFLSKPDGLVEPCQTLKQYEMTNSYIQQNTFFHYLVLKYPQLTTLKLHLNWATDEELMYAFEHQLFNIKLLIFITGLKQLTHLSIKFTELKTGLPYP